MAERRIKRDDVVHTDEETSDVSFRRHKPEYSDMCPVCKPRLDRNRRIVAIHRALVEFGYSTLTRENVVESYDRAMSGHLMEGEIIDKLVASQLAEAGLLPEGAHRD